jgi:hypothetical protein
MRFALKLTASIDVRLLTSNHLPLSAGICIQNVLFQVELMPDKNAQRDTRGLSSSVKLESCFTAYTVLL